MVRDMVKIMQQVEIELRTKMSLLNPQFILVGSIAEGTKTHLANELDLTVTFNALLEYPFKLGKDGFTLAFPSGLNIESNPLKDYISENGKNFEYRKFFKRFLSFFGHIMKEKENDFTRISKGRVSVRQKNCDCPKLEYEPKMGSYYTHCDNCIFTVSHTKCGVCLTFDWTHEEITTVLTIDLVPVFPIKNCKVMGLFSSVTKTLLTEPRPPNWLSYTRKFITEDMILPQSYQTRFESVSNEPILVGMKILHYGEGGNNFLIRPFQQLGVSTFNSNADLKEVYCSIKCLKSILKIDVSSYYIKKILLTDEVKNVFKINRGKKMEEHLMEHENMQNREVYRKRKLFYLCLNHEDLRKIFSHTIDYNIWEKYDEMIPLVTHNSTN